MAHKYEHVFTPIQLGPMWLKNRIVSLPMMSGLSTTDGKVTEQMLAHMRNRAKSGAGLILIGDSAIDYENAVTHYTPLNLGDEENLAGLILLAEEVHRYGAKIGIELQHGGRRGYEPILRSGQRISVDPEPPAGPNKKPSVPMDRAMMDKVRDQYCEVADRLMRAGFDEILVHCGHGWLLSQFLDPISNHRTDEYGGSRENRMRFPLEVLKALKEKVGHKMAIDVRVSVGGPMSPYTERDFENMVAFLNAAAPYITSANVSVSTTAIFATSEYMCQSYYLPHMVNTVWAERAKQAGVPVPVVATGSITTVAEAEDILARGKADLVGMGRATLADTRHITKVFQGKEEQVRPCLRCAHCTDRLYHFNAIRCAVNPVLGREMEHPYPAPAVKSKRVVIAGGGPAGMQAALACVERGHQVTLYEKSARLGGLLHTAAALPDKYDMKRYAQWLIRQTMETEGIRVVLNTAVTPELLKAEAPDAVLVAIGAELSIPPIPGIEKNHVVFAADVDTGAVEVGEQVVICGAGLTGCECAIPLAREGKQVTIIDMISENEFLKKAEGGQTWMSIMRLLNELGVRKIFDARVTSIESDCINYETTDSAKVQVPVQSVINAMGMRANYSAVQELLTVIPESYAIGDCMGMDMSIDHAVSSGFTYALEL